jgi:D-inositol-3-phosphate glycosyltransferase
MRDGSEIRDQRSASGFVEPTARREVRDQRFEGAECRCDQSTISDSASTDLATPLSDVDTRLSAGPSSHRDIGSYESKPAATGRGALSPKSRPLQAETVAKGCLPTVQVALLTGGGDKPYALGLAAALTSADASVDFIGSDDLNMPELLSNPLVNFLNLRGDQRPEVSLARKIARVATYYWRLIRYAATAQPPIFHILWNNKFELIDHVLLMLYYRLLGKKIVFTAHNVNAAKRDSQDSFLNRLSLRVQYRLSDHIFVHTGGMKSELLADFGVRENKVSVIPFGINNTVPVTALSTAEARRQLGISQGDKTLLFFGNIAPYKGLEYLIPAFAELLKQDRSHRLVIAGRPKCSEGYWKQVQQAITRSGMQDRIIQRIEYVPDADTEIYFKAADVLVLPYTHISQSGVLFLGYNFGLPVIASDVGSLKEDIIEDKTGFICTPQDPVDLTKAMETFFSSDLYRHLNVRREEIRNFARDRYSWSKVAAITTAVYRSLLVVS